MNALPTKASDVVDILTDRLDPHPCGAWTSNLTGLEGNPAEGVFNVRFIKDGAVTQFQVRVTKTDAP
jgi:hypothetical protein